VWTVGDRRRTDAEARDRAQLILGAVSLVLWFVVAFGLAITWYVDDSTPQPIFMAGGIALIVAAAPWLMYKPLVRRLRATH
jgi:membrane protein YdbS with pleckstrin-like domain